MLESPVPLGRLSSDAVHRDGGHTSENKRTNEIHYNPFSRDLTILVRTS